jgi:glycosyltransferase involved in cell wall biosynthesis
MKILMLAQFFPPDIGGEERHVMNLSNVLTRRGHEVSVATQLVPGTEPYEVLSSGVRIHRFRSSAMRLASWYADPARPHHPPVPDPGMTRQLARLIEELKPEVVHAHNWIVNSAVAIRRGSRGQHRFGLVLTLHDYSNVCSTKRMMRGGQLCSGPAMRRCLPCARSHYGSLVGVGTAAVTPAMRRWKERSIDHIVSVSSAVAAGNRVAEHQVPSSVIPNFVPDELVEATQSPNWSEYPSDDLPEEEFIFFAGDLSRDKGVPVLLEAYEALGEPRPALLMVGRPSPDTPAEVPKGVRIIERWPHHRIMRAFQRCQLAVLPSTWPDPCPTTVLEAMSCGRPVITTRTGGMVDMVEHRTNGLLVAPGDAAALSAAIRTLLTEHELRERLGAAGREQVRNFTASAVASRLEDVYRKVTTS